LPLRGSFAFLASHFIPEHPDMDRFGFIDVHFGRKMKTADGVYEYSTGNLG